MENRDLSLEIERQGYILEDSQSSCVQSIYPINRVLYQNLFFTNFKGNQVLYFID